MSREVNYAKLDYKTRQHYPRFKRHVESLNPQLTCQECGGSGGGVEPVLDDRSGPFMTCAWCLGTGLVTPHLRGIWLTMKKREKEPPAPASRGPQY